MKTSLFVLLCLCFVAPVSFGLTVITKTGRTINGILISEDESKIQIKDWHGVTWVLPTGQLDLEAMKLQLPLSSNFPNNSAPQAPIQKASGSSSIPSTFVNPADPTTPKPLVAKPVGGRLWSLQALMTNAYDSNINHSPDDIHSVGFVVGAGARWQSNVTHPALKIEYEVAKHSYSNTDQWDRVSQLVNGSYEWFFAKKMSLEVDSEASFKGSSEDREIGNQYTVEPQWKYKLTKKDRLEFYGAYRLKRYTDDPTRNSTDNYAGLVYERRLMGKTELALEFRYEENNAISAKHDYYRCRYGVSYTIPFRSRDWINVGFRFRQQNYPSRTVKINVDHGPDLVELRRDLRYNFNVDFSINLASNVLLQPGYTYESRSSNDVSKEFASHYPTLTVLYRWQ